MRNKRLLAVLPEMSIGNYILLLPNFLDVLDI